MPECGRIWGPPAKMLRNPGTQASCTGRRADLSTITRLTLRSCHFSSGPLRSHRSPHGTRTKLWAFFSQVQQQQPTPPAPARFDLSLAVALAGTAFEAYLQPLGGAGFEDTALDGCKTIFTDRDFLCELYQGILFVELKSATNLRVADFTGASDPYAVLSVGGSTAKSEAAFQTVNPKWGQKMCLYVRDMATDMLKIRVYDQDMLKSDDDLGFAMVPLSTLGVEPVDMEVPLKGPGAGEKNPLVQLRLTFLTFSDFPEDVRQKMTASKAVVPEQGSVDLKDVHMVPQILESVAREKERRRRRGPMLNALIDSSVDAVKDRAKQAFSSLSKLTASSVEDEPPSPWKVLATMVGDASIAYKPLAFVENLETDSQVWIFANQEAKEVVVAFRGTEQVKWKDLATDLNLTPTDLNPERLDSDAGVPFGMRLIKAAMGDKDMRVHSGFLQAYDSVRHQMVRLVDAITGLNGSKGQWRVLVTGHSLGGAIATLCAYELSARQGPARKSQRVAMYSFGAPRAGNKAFAEAYDKLVPDSWRITNSNDIVPSVPRLLGYAHVKHSVSVTPDGMLRVQADSKDVFGEGRSGVDVLQELVDKVQKEGKPWEQVYDEVAAHEMGIFNALVDGSALEEHMETFYLETLRACVLASTGASMQSGQDGKSN